MIILGLGARQIVAWSREPRNLAFEPGRRTTQQGSRRCIGSKRFGIEAHEAPVEDFPAQPSQKDGLGRMCKTHWNAYTAGLARDAKARKAAEVSHGTEAGDQATASAEDPGVSEAPPERKPRKATPVAAPAAGTGDDAG
jgi:hypothetical protein